MDDRRSQPDEMLNVDESRRDFLKFCSMVAAAIGLGPGMGSKVAAALTSASRPKILWLHFAECTGCTEAVLRTSNTVSLLKANDDKAVELKAQKWDAHTFFNDVSASLNSDLLDSFDDLILKTLSIDYHETLMAGAGSTVHDSLFASAEANKGNFICVVEGSIPTADAGVYGTVGGKTMLSIAREICPKARMIIALGTCASFGGIPYAKPNPTGAKNVIAALKDLSLPQVLNVSGCPPNPLAFVGTVAYVLIKNAPPPTDEYLRPLFAYGLTVHSRCPYLPETNDESDTSKCLRFKGCKGPGTSNICPTAKFNNGANFPMQARHVCIGCSQPNFWDEKPPFWKIMERSTPLTVKPNVIFEKEVSPVPLAVMPRSKTASLREGIRGADTRTFNALGRQVKSPIKGKTGKMQNKRTARGMLFEKTKDNVKKALEF
jgi:[NiFe] hydrogenase small subunit